MIARRKGRRVIATNVRLDRDLHRTLKAKALGAERSLNAEMLFRLRQSLEQQPGREPPQPQGEPAP